MNHDNNIDKIDFVIAWVDGNDPLWLTERQRYDPAAGKDEVRFRDWNLLRYWFRCVEKNASWVRKIHFVTWGHVPAWLDTENPKLHIVRHKDFIPGQYLPTFNANPIELNLHRIPGLAEHFVYFNDDMFLTGAVGPDYFFKNNLPSDAFQLNPIQFAKDSIGWINGSNIAVINEHFDMREVVRKNWRKVFSSRNGLKRNFKTLMLYFLVPWFPGLNYWHLTTSFLKETFAEVWDAEAEILEETCSCRFREKANVSQFLFKYWQLCTGRFEPMSVFSGHCYHLDDKMAEEAAKDIRKGKYKLICLNDTAKIQDVERCKNVLKDSFETMYPELSSFEKETDDAEGIIHV